MGGMLLLCLQITCMWFFREKVLSCILSTHLQGHFLMLLNPYPLFTRENCILLIFFVYFILFYFVENCILLLLDFLCAVAAIACKVADFVFFNLYPRTQYKHTYTPLTCSHSRLTICLLHSLFLTKPSFAFRVPKLNSVSPGCYHPRWYKQ